MGSHVVVIESINSHRTPQQFEALYLLMPTTQNVDRIIADFSNGRQQYMAAHVFFIEGEWTMRCRLDRPLQCHQVCPRILSID